MLILLYFACDGAVEPKSSTSETNIIEDTSNEPTAEPTSEPDSVDTFEEGVVFDFFPLPSQPLSTNKTLLGVHDVNSDSLMDILTLNIEGKLSWMQGNGEGEFSDGGVLWDSDLATMMEIAVSAILETNISITQPIATQYRFNDMNQDGQLDLLISLSGKSGLQDIYAAGVVNSLFTLQGWTPLQASYSPLNIVEVANPNHSPFVIFNSSQVLYWDEILRLFPFNSTYALKGEVLKVDFNGDTYLDWAILCDDGIAFKDFVVFYGTENGEVVPGPTQVPPSAQRLISDGNEHLIPASDGVYSLNSSQSWDSVLRYDPPIGYSMIGNFDTAPGMDLLHEHIENGVEAYANSGDGQFQIVTSNAPIPQLGMVISDIDGSGTDDIIWFEPLSDGEQLSVWMNVN
jgi:hypothetical protein